MIIGLHPSKEPQQCSRGQEPATLHELYADGSACTVGESSCHGPEEISRCLEETFGGAWLIDPDCGRVTLQALEGGAQGFVATVPGSLLLRGDGEEGRPREFSDELRIVAVEQSLWVETATHRSDLIPFQFHFNSILIPF